MTSRIAIFLLLAAAANLIGAWLFLLRRRWEDETLRLLVGSGAGFLLAVALIEMAPHSASLTEHAPLWILAGFLLIHVFEQVVPPHFHYGAETHTGLGAHAGLAATSGLTVHSLIDGVAIVVAIQAGDLIGWFVLIAMVWHRVPAGFTVASVALATGASRRGAFGAAVVLGAAALVGGFAYSALPAARWIGPVLGMSAGSLIHVAATDLLPEVNRRRTKLASWGVFLGVGLYYAAHWAVGH
jgi:ZIP family zinc transporter/zinc and cadmium transporter